MTEQRVKEYILPVKIVKVSKNVKNEKSLLSGFEKQNFFKTEELCTVKGKGYIILDFGKEIFGTARIMTNRYEDEEPENNIRVRFGESLTESCAEIGERGACNDHSTRDITFYMSANSDMEWGSCGFRFLRIDFLLEQTYIINKIVAGFIHVTDEKRGEFKGYGLEKIYDTAAYTLFLNMQNAVWDGVKRDQHLWVGDFYPEMLGILYSYGNISLIKEAFESILAHYPLPAWYNGIPSYNVWFLFAANDYVKYTGDDNDALISAVLGNLKQLEKCIGAGGELNFSKVQKTEWGEYFFEWPCEGTDYPKTGIFYLLKYALKKLVAEQVFNGAVLERAKAILAKIADIKYPITTVKSIEALRVLCGENVKESVATLKAGGAKGCSMLFTYFILKALAENGEGKAAVEIAKEYYGAMLDKGATTFWENFDIAWCENSSRIDEFPKEGEKDLHGDFGANCYAGFRHSLCHGWSCGVIPFLIENVAGIKIEGKGCGKISIKPLRDFSKSFTCDLPVPQGIIKLKRVNGELSCEVPKGVEVIAQRG